jgi:hypothetical protein
LSDGLEDLRERYELVGQQLAAVFPPGWKTAWCQVEMAEDHGSVDCFYVGEGAAQPAYLTASSELFDAFKALWDASPTPPWTTITFVLQADGSFEVDHGYDPIPLDEVVERRAAWKKQYLPQ